jgi:PAS domain S-box-containing protein
MPLLAAAVFVKPRPKIIDHREIYRTVLSELPAGVYFVDKEQCIAFCNRSAEEITGYLSRQVLGHHTGESFLA